MAGLVLLVGFGHGLALRDCTIPMPGWPRTSAAVTRVYSEWNGGSYTYAAVAEFRANGHPVYFTAPESSDVVKVGDEIRVTYEPGNPFLLHDLSVNQAIWKDRLYTSFIALLFVLVTLVVGLTLTDQKRLQRRSGI
jgi:hypothetical protein